MLEWIRGNGSSRRTCLDGLTSRGFVRRGGIACDAAGFGSVDRGIVAEGEVAEGTEDEGVVDKVVGLSGNAR